MISIYDTRVVEDNSYKDTTETICIRSIISYVYLFMKRKTALQAISEISRAQFVPISITIVFWNAIRPNW
jgi:hypothetical protein